MNSVVRYRECLLACIALGAFAFEAPARAADVKLPVKAPYLQPVFDWTGFYIGGHSGYSRGLSNAVLSDPVPSASVTGSVFSGVVGGVQGGYNWRAPTGLLLGVEADLTFPNYLPSNSIISRLISANSDVLHQLDYVGTARGRLGYASGHWLFYATGGLAFAGERYINTPAAGSDEKIIHHRLGWAAGALEQQPAPQHAAVGRRRGLLQSRTAAGFWLERHRRRRRLHQRRSAKIQFPLPALQHVAAVPAPDLRLRRRAGRTRQRPDAARRQGRRLQADDAGR